MNQSKIKVIFFGTPEFAVPALLSLIEHGYDIVAVVTRPDEPQGRKQIMTPPPVKVVAEEHHLNILQPESLKDAEIIETITSLDAELAVVAAYGKIIPQSILDTIPKGFLNIHPSLLPKYRGPSPIQTALLNGDEKTGVSIMLLDEQMDHGPIVAQEEVAIDPDEYYPELEKRLADIGAELLIKTIPEYLFGKREAISQDDTQATITKLIKTEDAEIFVSDNVAQAYNKIRAFTPDPGAFCIVEDTRLKILKAKKTVVPVPTGWKPGNLYAVDGQLTLCLRRGMLLLDTVQVPGSKPLSAEAFTRGYTKLISV